MIDGLGRHITYLRLSVTDRCDLRCTYCMSENPTFLPRRDILSLEELAVIGHAFAALGVRKIRLTGGEPLIRHNIVSLVRSLGTLVEIGQLDELTMTTNGTLLARHADELAHAGIRRINVSLDTLDPDMFAAITRRQRLDDVLAGLSAADAAGLKVKINTVIQAGVNEDDLDRMIEWCGRRGYDLTLIEAMPLGDTGPEHHPVSLSMVRADLADRWRLSPLTDRTGGPARYFRIAETGGRLGLITPLSGHFCDDCNRVRVNCRGELRLCLGSGASVDLRPALSGSSPLNAMMELIASSIGNKPAAHAFSSLSPQTTTWSHLPMHAIGG
ncbi:MAG: GTP 3',8-cyclase MoaA [Magnetospirillum sp.]